MSRNVNLDGFCQLLKKTEDSYYCSCTKVVDVTVLGLVGGVPGGETPRVADSSAAGAGRFFHNSVPQGLVVTSVLQAASKLGSRPSKSPRSSPHSGKWVLNPCTSKATA